MFKNMISVSKELMMLMTMINDFSTEKKAMGVYRNLGPGCLDAVLVLFDIALSIKAGII